MGGETPLLSDSSAVSGAPYLICAPGHCSDDCTFLALAAAGLGLLQLVIRCCRKQTVMDVSW